MPFPAHYVSLSKMFQQLEGFEILTETWPWPYSVDLSWIKGREPNQNHNAWLSSVNRAPRKTSAQEGWWEPGCSSAVMSLQGAQHTPPDQHTRCPCLSWPYYQTGTVVFLPYLSLRLSAKGRRFLKTFLHRESGRNRLEGVLWDSAFWD